MNTWEPLEVIMLVIFGGMVLFLILALFAGTASPHEVTLHASAGCTWVTLPGPSGTLTLRQMCP